MKGKVNNRVSRKELAYFALALATHVKAGESVPQACREVAAVTRNARLAAGLKEVAASIEAGAQPHAAFACHRHLFDEVFCAAVHLGEVTGEMGKYLERYSVEEQQAAQRLAMIRRAMWYPAAVTVASFVLIVLLMFYAMPEMGRLFHDLMGSQSGAAPLTWLLVRASGLLSGPAGVGACLAAAVLVLGPRAINRRKGS